MNYVSSPGWQRFDRFSMYTLFFMFILGGVALSHLYGHREREFKALIKELPATGMGADVAPPSLVIELEQRIEELEDENAALAAEASPP
jgi:hypothetical protein